MPRRYNIVNIDKFFYTAIENEKYGEVKNALYKSKNILDKLVDNESGKKIIKIKNITSDIIESLNNTWRDVNKL